MADALARRQGWKVARGGASSVEGPWPYAPVLEALSALCRRHPALLDALGWRAVRSCGFLCPSGSPAVVQQILLRIGSA